MKYQDMFSNILKYIPVHLQSSVLPRLPCNLRVPTYPAHLSHDKIVSRLAAHKHHGIVRNHPQRAIVPPLATILATPGVTHRVNHAIHTPHRAQYRRRNRISQSADEHGAEGGDVVLVEVLVRALRRVEGQHCGFGLRRRGLHLFVRGVFVGVGDLGCFAEAADAAAVPGADEEGGDAGGEDETVCVWISLWVGFGEGSWKGMH